jgi:hypothetical protein
VSGTALEQLVPQDRAFTIFERETREQDPVKEAFQKRGHRAPPGRIDEYQVIRPGNTPLRSDQIRFQFLDAIVTMVEDRVEPELGEVDSFKFTGCSTGALAVGICQGSAEASGIRMSQYYQYFL